jgi:hypothetical protein
MFMKKIFMVLVFFAVLGFGVFAENGVTFASDSTYVATVSADVFGLVANPNVSATVRFAPFTFVSTGNASFNVNEMDLTAFTFSQKIDFAYSVFDVYITPTVDFLNDFTLTLPAAFVLSKVVPFTTVTVASDVKGFIDGAGSVTVTAEVIF